MRFLDVTYRASHKKTTHFISLWRVYQKQKVVRTSKNHEPILLQFFYVPKESLYVMLIYSKEHKTKLVHFYFETKSIIVTQRKFKAHFKVKTAPRRSTILGVVHKFLREGSVENLNKRFSGRKRSARTPEATAKAQDAIAKSPKKSCRRLAQELGISRATAQRLLRNDLSLFPYKIYIHKLSLQDKSARK